MTLQPSTEADVQEAIRASEHVTLQGAGTKCAPSAADAGSLRIVSLARLQGLVDYSPEECVLTAKGGTRIAEIARVLASHGQYLPFDPPFGEEGATLGGTVAAGVNGPGRYRYGGVRDFVIGARVVDGEGRVIRSGGRVVKNAAGFLLHHALVGSGGRLGAITEITVKVFPRPEARRTLRVRCGSVAGAFAAARRVESLRRDCEAIDFDAAGTLLVRIAGTSRAIDRRAEVLADVLGTEVGSGTEVDGLGTEVASPGTEVDCVKVPGAMLAWPALAPHVIAAHFMCAGAIAWLWTTDLAALAHALEGARLNGQVIRGPRRGRIVGHHPRNEFGERVRRALDPRNRFYAASDSNR